MTGKQACKLVGFIEQHFDMVSQEDWFEFCDMVLDIVCADADKNKFASMLVKNHPHMFKLK